MTVRIERTRLSIWDFSPGSSPNPCCDVPHPTANYEWNIKLCPQIGIFWLSKLCSVCIWLESFYP